MSNLDGTNVIIAGGGIGGAPRRWRWRAAARR